MDPIIEKLESCKSFRVDARCEGYPDVIFEIILNAEPTQEQIHTAVSAMEKFYYAYNRYHFLCPIHYVGDISDVMENKHPRGIYIHMDFGGAWPSALVKALGALEKVDLPIYRVALL